MEEIIQVRHLKKYYQDVKAVDDISFSVEKGELFGFLGVNGAGKSTTINMLCTLLKPTEGTALIGGLELGGKNEEIKRLIGVVYQNNCLDNLLSVRENLLLRGSLYESGGRRLAQNLERVCEMLELTDVIRRPFGKLSGGQKRRCEIAGALMHTPEVLFLDEPTTGLDPATRQNVWAAIHSLRKEMKMTVFLTTHYMEEAAKANHIAILEQGRLAQFGTPFSLKEEFAGDRLRLLPAPGRQQEVQSWLSDKNLSYKKNEKQLTVALSSTMAAIPLLEALEPWLAGFEVIQGTLDDVFLKVTEGEKKYA